MNRDDVQPRRRGGRRTTEGRRHPRRLRPEVTALEGRAVLSTFTVTSLFDDGLGDTLRWAVEQANLNTGPDTIDFSSSVFNAPATIQLNGTPLELTDPATTTITGLGQARLGVSGAGKSRVFQVAAGASAALSDLTITDGYGRDAGGGIANSGTAILHNCTVSGNTIAVDNSGYSPTSQGGGIANFGNAILDNCTVSGNTATIGGGISNYGSLTVNGGAVSDNVDFASDTGGIANSGTAMLSNGCAISGNWGFGIANQVGGLTVSGCTISGNDAGGIINRYNPLAGPVNPPGPVTLDDCIISANAGNGIQNQEGTLTVGVDSAVSGNKYNGIANMGGTLILSEAVISGNGQSGIINAPFIETLNHYPAVAYISNCTVSGNRGGGIISFDTLTIAGSTISGNDAGEGYGGGIACIGSADISNCTISDNGAKYGGGIDNSGAMTLSDCTIADNGTSGEGGGIEDRNGGRATLIACTVSGNAATFGGGIAIEADSSVLLRDTIVAGNTTGGQQQLTASDIYGNADPNSAYNLIGAGGAGSLTNGDDGNHVGVTADDLHLGPLASNGGPTQTMALLGGCPAINAGLNALAVDVGGDPLKTDQRGFHRIVGGSVDIGAFEDQVLPLTVQGNLVATLGTSSIDLGSFADSAPDPGSATVLVNFGDDFSNRTVLEGIAPGPIGPVAHDYTKPGTYTVTVTVTDQYQDVSQASFTVTVQPLNIAADWGSQSIALGTADDGLRLLPAGRTTDLPFRGIKSLALTLPAGVKLLTHDVTITSAIGAHYGPATVLGPGPGPNYVILLAEPIMEADRVTITVGNAQLATFTRRLDVLPGDVNDDGVVDGRDATMVQQMIVGAIPPSSFGDINGDGQVDMPDENLVRHRRGTRLP